MEENGPDAKNQKKSVKHDSGAADLERVTDYAEEKEISSDVTGAIATIGERRRKEAQEKMEREIELSKVSIRKEDVELMGPVDTAAVADAVLSWLTDNKIHHTVFARTVLGWNTAFTPMLRKPVAWQEADPRARKAYQAMLAWLHRPHQERLDTVKEKQDQMNRKRRTESSHKSLARQTVGAGAAQGGQQLPLPAGTGYPAAEYGARLEPQYVPAPLPTGGGYSEDERSQPGLTALMSPSGRHQQQHHQQHHQQQQTQQTQFAPYGLTDVPPPSYRDSIQQQHQPQPAQQPQQQQQQMFPAGDRPPPLYSAPLPGYEELSRSYGPLSQQQQQQQLQSPAQEVSFAQLPPVSEVLQPPAAMVGVPQQQQQPSLESPPELLSPGAPAEQRPPQRVVISPLQRRALVDIFHVTPWPSPPMRQLIASKLDLPQRTVSNFFSAARSRGVRKRAPAAAAVAGAGADGIGTEAAVAGQGKENRVDVQD